jgi:hypothetical protein
MVLCQNSSKGTEENSVCRPRFKPGISNIKVTGFNARNNVLSGKAENGKATRETCIAREIKMYFIKLTLKKDQNV